jgi:biopolymer transport protein TolR
MAFGGGGGSGKVKSDINVTPLVDIVLVMLIIFLVAMPVVMRQIKTEVPKSLPSEPLEVVSDQVVVEVSKGGLILLNGISIDRVDLAEKVRNLLEHKRDKVVFVDFDDLTRYGDAVSIMDTVKGSGAKTVAIKTRDEGSTNGGGPGGEQAPGAPAGTPAPAPAPAATPQNQ